MMTAERSVIDETKKDFDGDNNSIKKSRYWTISSTELPIKQPGAKDVVDIGHLTVTISLT